MAKRERESVNVEKILVIMTDAYGSTEDYPAVGTDISNLSDAEIQMLYRSTPGTRRNKIRECNDDFDLGSGFDDAFPASIWEVVKEESIAEYTCAHHCRVIIAYFSE